MTKLLFLTDSYLKETETKVILTTPDSIATEETIFYSRGGGQDSDKGKVEWNGSQYEIIEIQKNQGNVFLKIGSHEIKIGDKVRLILDWQKRYKLMKYHTAAHILAAMVYNATNALITGNNIEEKGGRIDFNLEHFDKEQLAHFEEKANIAVKAGHEVRIYELEREKAMEIPAIFKLKDVLPKALEKFRIVEIEGIDKQACGGTHVKNTSEIGHIKITKTENKGKDNRRMYFEIA